MRPSFSSLAVTAILCHSVAAIPFPGKQQSHSGHLHMGFVKKIANTAQGLTGGLVKTRQADPQTSPQLDPSVIGPNLANSGIAAAEAGQAPSLTSTNNFINFCVGKTIMNGLQGPNGEQLCNPVPMGDIPSNSAMISCKFQSPANFATLTTNTSFDIVMAVNNFQTGDFVNPNTNYFAAPQQLNDQGQIIGHSHFVVEAVKSFQDTAPTDPTTFAYFKGVNNAAVDGKLTVTLTEGLPAGTYRIASINTAANHQPALVPVAQHGSLDDMIYVTVTDDGQADNATLAAPPANATDNAAASTTDAAAVSSSIDSAAAASSVADSLTAVSSAASTTDAAAATDVSSVAISASGAAGVAPTAIAALERRKGRGSGGRGHGHVHPGRAVSLSRAFHKIPGMHKTG